MAQKNRRTLKCRLSLRSLSINTRHTDMFGLTHAGSTWKLDVELHRCVYSSLQRSVWRAWITVYIQFSPISWNIPYVQHTFMIYCSTAIRWWVQFLLFRLPYLSLFLLCHLRLWILKVLGRYFSMLSPLLSAYCPGKFLESNGGNTPTVNSLQSATPALNLCKPPSQKYIYEPQELKRDLTPINFSTD